MYKWFMKEVLPGQACEEEEGAEGQEGKAKLVCGRGGGRMEDVTQRKFPSTGRGR